MKKVFLNQSKWLNSKRGWFIAISLILFAATVIRFYQLGNPTRGFYVDEAAIGYNAYSLLQTGKDEFGKSFPILFRSFADFKAPLYIYLSTIPVKIFGLTVFSTRLTSALSGLLTVLIAFLFIKLVINQNSNNIKTSTSFFLPSLVALVLATSPWHIYYSRGAWESNLSFFILLLASYFCFLGFTTRRKIPFLLGAMLFVLSAYAYHSQRIVAPLIFTYYLVYYRKWLLEDKKSLALGFLVLLLLALPLLRISLTPGGQSRIKSLSFFSTQTSLPWQNADQQDTRFKNVSFLADNHYLTSARKWLALYTAFFSPRNLFSPDPAEKQRWLVDSSVFYPWQFIFFVVGIACFIRKKKYALLRQIVLPWLLLSPIAASITGDPFATQRTSPLIFPFSVIIALGIFDSALFMNQQIFSKTNFKYTNILIASLFFLVTIVSLIDLATQLFFVLPYQRAKDWQIGYSELTEELLKHPNEKIVVDNTRGEGYIQILFFTKFDPATYQKEAGYMELPDYYYSFERVITKKFGQFEYQRADRKEERDEEHLIVGDELLASREAILGNPRLKLIKEVKYPDQSVAFRIIQVKKDNNR